MFDPKSMVQGAIGYAPGFILARPNGVIDGLIGATLTMAFWCSATGWISSFLSVVLCAGVAYGVGRGLDVVIPLAIRVVDPTFVVSSNPPPVVPVSPPGVGAGLERPSEGIAAAKKGVAQIASGARSPTSARQRRGDNSGREDLD